MADLLAQQPLLAYVAVALLGLIVGSFLNVVILRLPRMMEAQWRAGAAEILGQPADAEAPVELSLARPRSRCNSCQTPIRAWHNIPVVSYLLLRGRCAACGARISWQYPAVEITAAVMAVIVLAGFGATPFPPLFVGGAQVASPPAETARALEAAGATWDFNMKRTRRVLQGGTLLLPRRDDETIAELQKLGYLGDDL